MRNLNIDSTAIAWATYDENTQTLEVKFHSGATAYTSWNVPKSVITSFENASSQGSYYMNNIKNYYG